MPSSEPDTTTAFYAHTPFIEPVQYKITYNISQYPSTYGVIGYVENRYYGPVTNCYFSMKLMYKLPNSSINFTCDDAMFIEPGDTFIFQCDIHEQFQFFPDQTEFTIILNDCILPPEYGEYCVAVIFFSYLSILNMTPSKNRYSIQTDGITRYHYFKIATSVNLRNVLILTLEDLVGSGTGDCKYCCDYSRCIYVDTNYSFPDSNHSTLSMTNCNYTCMNDHFVEQLNISIPSSTSNTSMTYYVGIYIHYNDNLWCNGNLQFYTNDVQITYSINKWKYIIILLIAFSFILCCLFGICLKNRRNIKRNKFLHQWNLFYADRYKLLLTIFIEKGIVDMIQSYLDDLETVETLKDETTFRKWYSIHSHSKKNWKVQLETPLIVHKHIHIKYSIQ